MSTTIFPVFNNLLKSIIEILPRHIIKASSMAQMAKNPSANAGEMGLIPTLGRSPEEANGKPF